MKIAGDMIVDVEKGAIAFRVVTASSPTSVVEKFLELSLSPAPELIRRKATWEDFDATRHNRNPTQIGEEIIVGRSCFCCGSVTKFLAVYLTPDCSSLLGYCCMSCQTEFVGSQLGVVD